MAVDHKATLAFLHELSEAAMTAARAGDPMLANRLGANVALQHYFNNVFAIQSLRPDVWAQNYPQYLAEADRVRQAHDADEQRDERMSAIEEQLAKLAEMVATLTEAQQPAKPKRGKKVIEAEAEAEPEPADEPDADEDEPDAEAADDEPAEDENEAE